MFARFARIAALTSALFAFPALAQTTRPVPGPPPQASAVGYNTLTFNSTFKPARFNVTNDTSGFEWYLFNFFSYTPITSAGYSFNADGTFTLTGNSFNNANGQIATAGFVSGNTWVGTAFGGGAYFEATYTFNASSVNTANGWPSFWALAIEHDDGATPQWPGQAAGYTIFGELDFSEYDTNAGWNVNGVTYHNHYGVYNVTCSSYCDSSNDTTSAFVHVASNIVWNQYHKYGVLWIPSTSGSNGSATFYLDDVQYGTPVTWSQFTNQSPPPSWPTTTWMFGIFDQQHFPVILGTGTGQSMTISSVRVWQASTANNLVH